MANYHASARSSYFKVKDLEAFKAWAQRLRLGVWESDRDPGDTPGTRGMVAINTEDTDDGGWPSLRVHCDANECPELDTGADARWFCDGHDIDFAAELAEHLERVSQI